MSSETTVCNCFKCGGKGVIRAFSGIANGICFQCGGSGKLTVAASKKSRESLSEYNRVRCEWILASTPSTFEGFTYERLAEARTYACQCTMNRAVADVYGRTVHEAWMTQGGDEAFMAKQEDRLSAHYE